MLHTLIRYFVDQTKGHITKTQLVKFLYLADLYSVKWTEKQLTDLDWRYYTHGPWTKRINEALSDLSVEIEQERLKQVILLRPTNHFQADDLAGISQGVKLMLKNICREWSGPGEEKFDELLSYVYSTAPMVEAKEKHRPEEEVPLNLNLERSKLLQSW